MPEECVRAAQIAVQANERQLRQVLDRWTEIENSRESRQAIIQQTTMCDGSTRPAVRAWLADLDLANRQEPNMTVYVATKTVSGALRKEVERFLADWVTGHQDQHRNDAPWPELRAHVANSFLGAEEMARKKGELAQLRQQPYEETENYVVRFRDAMLEAYPDHQLGGDDVQGMLREMFLRSLRSDDLARRVSGWHDVQTVNQAFEWVQRIASAEDRYRRLGREERRQEEPMEVSTIAQAPEEATGLKQILERLDGIQSRIRSLETQQKQRKVGPRAPRFRQTPERNDRKEPKLCFACGKPVHFARECPTGSSSCNGRDRMPAASQSRQPSGARPKNKKN